MDTASLGFFTRVWLAWLTYFKIVFDGRFAARVRDVDASTERALKAAENLETAAEAEKERAEREKTKAEKAEKKRAATAAEAKEKLASEHAEAVRAAHEQGRREGALLLLSMLQEHGRFADFVSQDVSGFKDAEVGVAARVVHDGCKKALAGHVVLAPVRAETEGSKVEVKSGEVGPGLKLTGDVRGSAPWKGVLRHAGWRAEKVSLPSLASAHDVLVVCPAEVEL